MEEILVPIATFLIEFLLEFLVYFGFDLKWRDEKGKAGCGYILLFLALGAGMGLLVNWIHPKFLLHHAWQRIAAVIAGPLLCGALSWFIARERQKGNAAISPGEHFLTAFVFALGLNLVRLAGGVK